MLARTFRGCLLSEAPEHAGTAAGKGWRLLVELALTTYVPGQRGADCSRRQRPFLLVSVQVLAYYMTGRGNVDDLGRAGKLLGQSRRGP